MQGAVQNHHQAVITSDQLRRFALFREMSAEQLENVAKDARIIAARKGEIIFREGEKDERMLFLVDGDISCIARGQTIDTFHADSPRAAAPLAQAALRPYSARANVNSTLLCVDRAVISNAQTGQQHALSGYEIEEIEADDRGAWLNTFLRSNAFLRLPAANLQALVARMEEVPVNSGQVVIHQGASANNYYIVRSGRFRVMRQIQGSEDPLDVAVLGPGDGFGEDALITRGRRNASVIALEDGCLMRLSRHNFTSLLVNSLLHPISYADARALANKGAAFLDVRAPHEFRRYNIPGSINIPLPLLRANLARLHSGVEYITYCNSGNFSAAAAFLLAQGGLKVRLLAGGLKAHEGLLGQAAPTSRENETPAAQVADTRATPTSALGQTEPVAAVERNDTRLWTPIPAARDLPPEKLRILEPLNVAAPTRNRDVRCIERPEDIAWAQQSLPRSAREQASSTPLSSTHGTAAPQKQDVELGWISDTHLWETVLGYRRDPSVDKLLDSTSSGDAAPRPAQQSGPIGGGRPTRNYVGAQSAAIRGSSATRTAASKTVRAAGERPSVTNYTVVQATNRPLRVVLASLAMFAAMGVSLTLMPTSVIEKLGPGATLTSQRLNQTTQRQANAQTSASAPLPRNNATAHGRERLPADGTPSNGTAPSAPTQAPPEVAIF